MANSAFNMTVPQYYTKFIDNKVNLDETTKVCCPFHKEKTPSFSYIPSTGTWRCYGACKTGGDIVDLHKMNYKLKNKIEAENSLYAVLGMQRPKSKTIEDLKNEQVFIDQDNVELDRIYHLCLVHATTPDRWVDMDYAMSLYPVDVLRLKDLLSEWKIKYDD